MKRLAAVIYSEMRESMRAKWFYLYGLVFGGAIILLFSFGITESQVLGFAGVDRLLIIYIQLCIVILPIFILISTVRAMVGDKETSVLEYFLSMPISLFSYYWGKFIGKLLVVLIPTLLAFFGALLWSLIKDLEISWPIVSYYIALLFAIVICFLGIGMFISSMAKKVEWALGLAFLVWLTLLLFIDVIMIGLMLKHQINESIIIGITLLNPLQVFRVASIILFDPQGSILGPSSFVILDFFGRDNFLLISLGYPVLVGLVLATSGYYLFKKGDLV